MGDDATVESRQSVPITYEIKLDTSKDKHEIEYNDIEVETNSTVQLRCAVTGDGAHSSANLHWVKDSLDIEDETIDVTVDSESLIAELRIGRFDADRHTGNYDCKVTRKDEFPHKSKVALSGKPLKYDPTADIENGFHPCAERFDGFCKQGRCLYNPVDDFLHCSCYEGYSGSMCERKDHFVIIKPTTNDCCRFLGANIQTGMVVMGVFMGVLLSLAILMAGLWARQKKRSKSQSGPSSNHRISGYDEEKAALVDEPQLMMAYQTQCWNCGVRQRRNTGTDTIDLGGIAGLLDNAARKQKPYTAGQDSNNATPTHRPFSLPPAPLAVDECDGPAVIVDTLRGASISPPPRSGSLPGVGGSTLSALHDYDPTCTDCIDELRRLTFPRRLQTQVLSTHTPTRRAGDQRKPRSQSTAVAQVTASDGSPAPSSSERQGDSYERRPAAATVTGVEEEPDEDKVSSAASFITDYLPMIQRRQERLYGVSSTDQPTEGLCDPTAQQQARRSISSPTSPEMPRQRHGTGHSAHTAAAAASAKNNGTTHVV